MRAWWILPNRGQMDDVPASDGERTVTLREVLDPSLRPEGFSHGVPAELLEKYGPEGSHGILFAQRFPAQHGRQQLFIVSAPAGLDASGRVVHIGLLVIPESHERPRFDIPFAGLPEEDRRYAKDLVSRMTSPEPGDLWARSVRELAEAPPGSRPETNVALDRSAVRFDSLYAAGSKGPTRRSGIWRKPAMAAITALLLGAAAGTWLSEHSCGSAVRTAANGVWIWHSS